MAAFVSSLVILFLGVGICLFIGRRRPLGTPLTWGEAFVAATFVFFGFVVAYGLIPHYWLQWADSELAWRKDKIGIPLGPLGMVFWHGHKGKLLGLWHVDKNCLWPEGITFFGRGRIKISAEQIRDLVGATIYIVMLAVQFSMWASWQKRGKVAKERAEREALSTSAYGRPLKKAEA